MMAETMAGHASLAAPACTGHGASKLGRPVAALGGATHHRYQVAVALGLDAQHAEAALGVVEGDALDRAGQHLDGWLAVRRIPGEWPAVLTLEVGWPVVVSLPGWLWLGR